MPAIERTWVRIAAAINRIDKGDVRLTIPQVKTLRGVRARVSGIVSLSRIGWS